MTRAHHAHHDLAVVSTLHVHLDHDNCSLGKRMSRAAARAKSDPDAYLICEAGQAEKHECFRGEVFAMVGTGRGVPDSRRGAEAVPARRTLPGLDVG
jgi:hypothetical protein